MEREDSGQFIEPSQVIANAFVEGAYALQEDNAPEAVRRTHEALKSVLLDRYGDKGNMRPNMKSVYFAAANPRRARPNYMFAKTIGDAGADQDTEVVRLAREAAAAQKGG